MTTKTTNGTTATAPKAYSYLRFSTPEQMKGDSFRRQTELSERYARDHGLELDTSLTLQDLGVSAFRGRNVEEGALGDFLEAVRQGKVSSGSFLLVESLDRLSRQSPYRAFRQFSRILDQGVNVVTLQDGKTYTASGGDLAFSDLMVSIAIMQRAHEESLTKSRRLAEAWKAKRAKAAEGQIKLTGRCPEWLTLDKETMSFRVLGDRADVVRRIFSMTLEGIGKQAITKTLNSEGVPTFGKSQGWHSSYVAKILRNGAVIGLYQPHKMKDVDGKRRRVPSGDPIEDYFPAVVPLETFLKVQRMRDTRAIPAARIGAQYSNLFSGIARCGACGGVMHYENKGKPPKGGSYLVCSHARRNMGCARHAWRYPEAQAHIISNLLELDFRELFPSLYERGRETITKLEGDLLVRESELEAVEGKLERLTDLLLERETSPTLLDRLDALEQEKADLARTVEETRLERDKEQERLDGIGQEYSEVGQALQDFVQVEREGNEEERLEVRRRMYHLLQRSISRIIFTPGEADEGHGTITVHLSGMEDAPLRIVVSKDQKNSSGFSHGKEDHPDVTVIDAVWPPTGRVLGMAALKRLGGKDRRS